MFSRFLIENKRQNTLVFFLVVLLYCITNFLYKITFEAGDDILMQQIIQGSVSGSPDVHLVFMNSILGYILKPFYLFDNQIYWYSGMLFIFQFISFFVILKFVFQKKQPWYIILSTLFFFQYFIIRFQFTSIAGLTCLAAVLLYCYESDNNTIKKYTGSFILFLFSSLLRFDMFMLMFVLSFTVLLLESGSYFGFVRKVKYVFFVPLFLVIFGISYFDKILYENDVEWSYFKDFNKIRGSINDNSNLKKYIDYIEKGNPQLASELKVVEMFVYPQKYDVNELTSLKKTIGEQSLTMLLYNTVIVFKSSIKISLGIVFLGALGLYFFIKKDKRFLFFVLFSLIFVYVNFNAMFKPRLLYPILLLVLVFYVLNLNNKLKKLISVFFILTFIVYNTTYFFNNDKYIKPINYKEIKSMPQDKLLFCLDSPELEVHPFKLNLNNNLPNIIEKGWLSNSPLYIEKLKRFGINIKQNFSIYDHPSICDRILYYYNGNVDVFNANLIYQNFQLVPYKEYKKIYIMKKIITNK